MTESPAKPYLGPYRVKAFNASKESENKIHDDAVARRRRNAIGGDAGKFLQHGSGVRAVRRKSGWL